MFLDFEKKTFVQFVTIKKIQKQALIVRKPLVLGHSFKVLSVIKTAVVFAVVDLQFR